MERNQIVIGVVSLIAIFGFLFGAYYFTGAGGKPPIDPTVLAVKQTDHIKWNTKSKNVLVEYSDLQCPACKTFQQVIKTIETGQDADSKKIRDNVAFVYRHFPLTIHPNADEASYAAEAAGQQGKFFQMVDLLFEKQSEWEAIRNPEVKFNEYAKALKLDEEKFKAAYKSDSTRSVVRESLKSGEAAQVQATPTFYLNGEIIRPQSFDQFKALLLAAANK